VVDPTVAVDAIRLVDGERQETYGTPDENLGRIAGLWEAYLRTPVSKEDVAVMMVLVKLSRMKGSYKRDNAVDGVGYLLLADSFGRYNGSK
jgi:Domain of unknown function (DUF6378)